MKKKILGGFLSIFVLILMAYHLAYWNRIYPGVTIAGQPVGNKTVAEVITNYELRLPAGKAGITNSKINKILLTDGNRQWEIDLGKIDFRFDATQSAQKAYRVGRNQNPFDNLKIKTQAWFQGINLPLDYSFNQPRLDAQIALIAGEVFKPAIEPNIKLIKGKIVVEPGKEGQELDEAKLLEIFNFRAAGIAFGDARQFSIFNFDPIKLPIKITSPQLTPDQIERSRQRAEKFLGKKLILTAGEKNQWTLKENDFISFLSFTEGFNQEKIATWTAELAKIINHSPENAAFQFSEGKVIEFRPATEGKILDQTKTVDLVLQNLTKLEESEKEIKVSLPIITTPPQIQTADVNNLGIQQLIGQGVSFFRGSINQRIHNIQLAASKLNGLLVAPGETFSFNQALGEVDQTTGYEQAYIIKEGRTVLGDGGGVCQVSTTLFRAALNAGLPIIERHAHAYRVGYYEQNSPAGLDATVFDPTADLKIKNDTPAHILIQTKTDTKNKILTFGLYGTADGRKVNLSKPKIWDQVPPPPDLYQDDPTLPAGQTKQIDWSAWGAKVSFDYKVVRNGETLQNRTFYSAYQPWQAIYLRGTK